MGLCAPVPSLRYLCHWAVKQLSHGQKRPRKGPEVEIAAITKVPRKHKSLWQCHIRAVVKTVWFHHNCLHLESVRCKHACRAEFRSRTLVSRTAPCRCNGWVNNITHCSSGKYLCSSNIQEGLYLYPDQLLRVTYLGTTIAFHHQLLREPVARDLKHPFVSCTGS